MKELKINIYKAKEMLLKILVLFSFCFSFSSIKAANYYWKSSAVDNLFTNIGNWETAPGNGISPSTAPGSADDVFFPLTSNFASVNLNNGIAQNFNFTASTVFTFTGTGSFYGNLNANGNARFSGRVFLLGNTVKTINLAPNPNTTTAFFTAGGLECNEGTVNLAHNIYHGGSISISANSFNSNGYSIVANQNLSINTINGDFSGSLIDVGHWFLIYCYAVNNNNNLAGARIVLRSTTENINFNSNYPNHSPLKILGSNPLNFQSLKLINNKTLYGASNPNITVDSLIIDCDKIQTYNLTNFSISNLIFEKPCNINNITENNFNIGNVTTPPSCKGQSMFYGPTTINTLSSITNNNINFNGVNFTGVGYNASSSNNIGNNTGTAISWGSALPTNVFHWVGNAGDWKNPENWSISGSGGVPQSSAGCIPTFNDSVVFDNNSFSLVGELVNTQNTSAMCKSITVIDTDNEGSFNGIIDIAGNANFSGANAVHSINLLGLGSHILNSGTTLTYSGNIVFRMEGSYTLASPMYTNGVWLHYSGSFVSNGYPISSYGWSSRNISANSSNRNINIENSTINVNGSGGHLSLWVDLYFSHANLNSLLASNSTININRANGTATFFQRGIPPSLSNPTFNNLHFTSSTGTSFLRILGSQNRYTFNNILFNSNGTDNSSTIETYNVDTLHLTSGKNYSFASNHTYYINHINTVSNACNELAAVSSSRATQTRFYKLSPPFNGNNLLLNGVNATGATLNVMEGVDNGGLTNVNIVPASDRNLYWVGGTGNWDDGSHWSIGVSGGNPAITNPSGCIPRPIDNVYFDSNSFTITGQTVTLNVDGSCKDMIWDVNAASYAPNFMGSLANNLNIYGSLEINDGVIHNHTGKTIFRGTDTIAFSQTIKTNNVLFGSMLQVAGGGRYDFISNHFQTGNAGLGAVNTGGHVVTNGYNMRFAIITYGTATTIPLSNVNKIDFRNSLIEIYSFFGGGNSARIIGINKSNFLTNDSTSFNLTSHASLGPSHLYLSSNTLDTINIGEVTFSPLGIGTLNTNNTFKFNKVEFTQATSLITGSGTVIIDTLVYAQSSINTIASNKTVVVNDTLVADGTPCSPLEINSSSLSSPAFLESGKCNFDIQFASLRDITANTTNGCLVTDYQVVGNNVGGNNNWTFSSINDLTQLGPDTIIYCTESPYTINTNGFGGLPVSYIWSTGDTTPTIQVNSSGTYFVNVNYALGCNISDTIVITIIDTVSPSITCIPDSIVYLNSNCQYETDDFTNLVSVIDDCTPNSSIILSQNPSVGTIFNGESIETIWVYAQDNYGNIDSCSFQLTLIDTLSPSITCSDTTIYLDNTGQFIIDTSFILNAASDNCGVDSIWTNDTLFNCLTVGVNTATVYVQDDNGNIDSCIANVTVVDSVKPVISCLDTTIYLNNTGQFIIDTSFIFSVASDNCGVDSIWTNDTLFNCLTVGSNIATLYVRDVNGNLDSCIANVTVVDSVKPVVSCLDTTIYLSAAGAYSIDTSYVFVNANDNCGVDSIWISNNNFTCSGVGVNFVKIYVRDVNSNIDSCISNVTVLDTVPPMISCKDTIVYLNNTGQATIDTSFVYNSSFAGCGLDSIWIVNNIFTCTNTGANQVWVYARDVNNNMDSCLSTVTVSDTIKPTIICKDTIIYLDVNGQFTIDTSYVHVGSNDNCGVDSIWMNNTIYNCNTLGVNTANIFIKDVNGNIDSCSALITVLDTIFPTIVCKDTIAYLNTSGQVTIDTSFVVTTISDNCNIDSVWINNSTFNCNNTGTNTIIIYVQDASGNVDSCLSTVTILDTIKPLVSCQNVTIQLDSNGQGTITLADVNNMSSDNCSIQQLYLSGNTSFNCANIGNGNTVYLVGIDASGNIDSCQSIITIQDNIQPTFNCPGNIFDTLINICDYQVPDFTNLITSINDNCTTTGGYSMTQIPVVGSIIDSRLTPKSTISLFVTDANNNTNQCEIELNIHCLDEITIPRFISPNNDGFNDTWVIKNIELYPNSSVIIYNRWGREVYSKLGGYDNSWGGETKEAEFSNGKEQILPSGTYFFTLDLGLQKSTIHKGYIQIRK